MDYFFKMQKQSSRGALGKKVFLEIPQNSQENTCARVSFLIKLQALDFNCGVTNTVTLLLWRHKRISYYDFW